MSNKVKWMHSGMTGAPVLTNNWGSLTALLDALLVNGFHLKPVSALTRDGTTATAVVGSAHGYLVDQVVRIEGCEEPEYNGEFTITAITQNSIQFAVPSEPATPATTVLGISAKMAPLGFEIAFTGENKRAYRLRSKGIVNSELEAFADENIDNVLALFTELNGATHGPTGKLGLPALREIKRRVEESLLFLCQIAA